MNAPERIYADLSMSPTAEGAVILSGTIRLEPDEIAATQEYIRADLYDAQATILNAVASGQLVPAERKCPIGISPDAHEICSAGTCDVCTASLRERLVQAKTDADLAVAEALRKAKAEIAIWRRTWAAVSWENAPDRNDRAGGITYGRLQGCDVIAEAIGEIANQDHLAEVQALRTERDKQKADANKWFDLALSNRHKLEAAEAEVARLKEAVIAYLADDKLDTGILEAALTPKGDTP